MNKEADLDQLYCGLCQKDTVHQIKYHATGFGVECSECYGDPKFFKLMSKLNKIEKELAQLKGGAK